MSKTIFKQFLMIIFGLTFLISCQQDDLQNVPDEKASDGLNSFLGKKLENPLSNNGNHQQQAVNDLFNAYFYN